MMKKLIGLVRLVSVLQAVIVFPSACSNPVLPGSYTLEFPEPPSAWKMIPGGLSWLVEWRAADGRTEKAVVSGAPQPGCRAFSVSLPAEWPSPVSAWPFWPGLEPGLFRPAGAIYPFDADGDRLILSWRGGVDAAFFRALEEAAAAKSAEYAGSPPYPVRQPHFFNWPRFRKVMAGEIQNNLAADPWLVDWKSAAGKTVSASFRTSYVSAGVREPVNVVVPLGGPWFSASPFRVVENWTAGDVVEMALGADREIWYCAGTGGILVLSKTAQLWRP